MPAPATYIVFSIARERTVTAQWSSFNGPATHAAGSASTSAPASAACWMNEGKRSS